MQLFHNHSWRMKEGEPSFFRRVAGFFTPPPSPPPSAGISLEAKFQRTRDGRRSNESLASDPSFVTTAPSTRSKSSKTSQHGCELSHAKSLANIHPHRQRSGDYIEPRSPPAYICAFKDCWSDYCPTHNPNGSRQVAQARRVASMKSLRRLHTASPTSGSSSASASSTTYTPSLTSMSSRTSSDCPPLPPSPPASTIRYERKKYECYAQHCEAANCPRHGGPLTRPNSAPSSPIVTSPVNGGSHILYFPLPPSTVPDILPYRAHAPTPNQMVDSRRSVSRSATSPEVTYTSHRAHIARAPSSYRPSASAGILSHPFPPPPPAAAEPHPSKVIKQARSSVNSLSLQVHQHGQKSVSSKDVEHALHECQRALDSLTGTPFTASPISAFPHQPLEPLRTSEPVPRRKRNNTVGHMRKPTLRDHHPYHVMASPVGYAI
ncbi:hypothetical protein DACRYDRAFT_109845 [Dacryopinax primogenitus]|uniref:Uncharacterized protein n=1 Tax=Dacryopinax primogenitus (strain DJM 731) TaxID=1858805 RepID=M5FVV3_DACPD|nr:uncharacterized protein DACRYDRAFT_109845 [Dacryopinax primogenitus]EJT99739.1 hypothetical protein DACRYDRAFT_109845 [Dacryopinax primogenitus]